MITICHITTVHIAKDIRIYHKECKALAESGYDVKLLVVNAKDTKSDYPGVKIINVPVDALSKVKRILNAPKKARLAAERLNADVYHFHDPEFLFEAIKLSNKGFNVIYDAHEDVPNQVRSKYWIPAPFRPLISYLVKRVEMHVASKLSAVVTVVDSIANRFALVTNQVLQVRNYPVLTELPEPVEWSNKEQLICYVGDITEIRGVFDAVKALPNSQSNMLLAGRFPNKEFEKRVIGSAGWKKVDFLGFINRNEIVDVLNRSKIGLVTLHPTPSYLEALPVKLFEYMAAGIPVIASNFGWLKKIVEEHKCGIAVDPQDSKEIADAINWLCDHDDEARQMGERGRKAVEEGYNWASEEKKLIDLYSKILAN